MYTVVLSEIEKETKETLLSNVGGLAPELPKVGNRFFMYTKPTRYNNETRRHYFTDTVVFVRVVDKDRIVCQTTNALFELSNIVSLDAVEDEGEI